MENEFEKYVVKRDGKKDLSFYGEELNWVSSNTGNSSRWTEYTLYQTKKGKYVIQEAHYTLWQDEFDTYDGYVGNSLKEVFSKAFNLSEPSDLVKELAKGFLDLTEYIE